MYVIIGASSFIGRHLYNYCKKKDIYVVGTYYTRPYNSEWVKFDLCTNELEEVCYNYFGEKKPEAVIICGANASIDNCKNDETASNRLNVIGMERLLKQIDRMGAKSVFLSSEAVFDGNKGMYTEEDKTNPITLYGKQKLKVEEYIIQNIKEYLIFRISRAVGSSYGENDIFNDFYTKVVNNDEIVCLKGQSFCITEVDDIAQAIVKALEEGVSGLYHLSSDNYLSRYELANFYIKKIFGSYKKIVEKEYDEIPFLDRRHIYGGLRGDKLTELLKIRFMSTEQILSKYAETFEGRRYEQFT